MVQITLCSVTVQKLEGALSVNGGCCVAKHLKKLHQTVVAE